MHQPNNENVWRVPFGLQLVPAGFMCLGLFTVKVPFCRQVSRIMLMGIGVTTLVGVQGTHAGGYHESRILGSERSLATLQRSGIWPRSKRVSEKSVRLAKAFVYGKRSSGRNFIQFVITIVFFTLLLWSGQNSVGYYVPQVFSAVSSFKLMGKSVR